MQIFDSISDLEDIEKGWALTIGNFDGVHLGHQEIIKAAKAAARNCGAPGLAVMTFEPHPAAILHPEKAPQVLTSLELKKHLLKESGVDCLIVLKDSFKLLNLAPRDFVDEFLMKRIEPKVVIEGVNFNFGYGRSGDAQTLKELGAERGFEVIIVPSKEAILADGQTAVCSSSMIRGFLEKGEITNVKAAMGRHYRLMGQIVQGRGVGAELGFPTANIQPAEQSIPAEGVYAGFVGTADSLTDVCASDWVRPAAISIGRAKTFVSEHPLLVEAHILEESVEDLAGKWLAMDFVKRIRSQKRFETKNQLVAQIAIDCKKTTEILKST
jgi:riboflavin kinase/FMN adenylyltransferase